MSTLKILNFLVGTTSMVLALVLLFKKEFSQATFYLVAGIWSVQNSK